MNGVRLGKLEEGNFAIAKDKGHIDWDIVGLAELAEISHQARANDGPEHVVLDQFAASSSSRVQV